MHPEALPDLVFTIPPPQQQSQLATRTYSRFQNDAEIAVAIDVTATAINDDMPQPLVDA